MEGRRKRKRDCGGGCCRGCPCQIGVGDTSPSHPAAVGPSQPLEEEDSRPCLEVRPTLDERDGVGTFATLRIKSGEILVSEEPVISVLSPGSPHSGRACARCLTPLGHLRWHVVSHLEMLFDGSPDGAEREDASAETLPGLGDEERGPEFTPTSPGSLPSCRCGEVWCSAACRKADANLGHRWLCPGPTRPGGDGIEVGRADGARRRFRDFAESNGADFLLAGKAMAAALRAVAEDRRLKLRNPKSTEGTSIGGDVLRDEALLWWRQYNCPLWWNIGAAKDDADERDRRRELCRKGHSLLLDAFRSHILEGKAAAGSEADCNVLPPSIVDRVCTEFNLAEVLGMLHCNVMEIEYASPAQQYFDHLKHAVEEEGDGSDFEVDGHSLKSWILGYFPLPPSDERVAEVKSFPPSANPVASAAAAASLLPDIPPVVGSGLFPVLSLANHHCDPNASIEFLGESREGSLVALRDISAGEEICVTYVPNGDWDCGDETGERFRNFRPTKTWKYLNQEGDEGSDADSVDASTNDASGCESPEIKETAREFSGRCPSGSSVDDHDAPLDLDCSKCCETCNENDSRFEDILIEGSKWTDRRKALSEYGFICRCSRCEHERSKSEIPYCRHTHCGAVHSDGL